MSDSESKYPLDRQKTFLDLVSNYKGDLDAAFDLFEDSWSGPNNAWHNTDSGDQWYNGNDEWHGQASGNMAEDFAAANLVTTENKGSFSDVISAVGLIQSATNDPQNEKHKYFTYHNVLISYKLCHHKRGK